MLFRIFYTLHNLQLVVMKQFVLLYSHPMVPFLKHQSDMLLHIVYNQYKCHKF